MTKMTAAATAAFGKLCGTSDYVEKCDGVAGVATLVRLGLARRLVTGAGTGRKCARVFLTPAGWELARAVGDAVEGFAKAGVP